MKCTLLGLSVILLVVGFSLSGQTSPAKVHILPFKVWKQKKIDEARTVVSELKRHKSQIKNDSEIEGISDNVVIDGKIEIQGYDPLEGLFAEVMHLGTEVGGKKAGCRFVKINLATRQRISFLVNACHRDVFGILKK